MFDVRQKYKILSAGLLQREKYLCQLQNAKSYYQNLSDFGWFLTLGSEAFGMLTAVTSGKQARDIHAEIKKVENEINFLRERKKAMEANL
jgi:hypothetical protein